MLEKVVLGNSSETNSPMVGTGHRVIRPKLQTKHSCELQDKGVAVIVDISKQM